MFIISVEVHIVLSPEAFSHFMASDFKIKNFWIPIYEQRHMGCWCTEAISSPCLCGVGAPQGLQQWCLHFPWTHMFSFCMWFRNALSEHVKTVWQSLLSPYWWGLEPTCWEPLRTSCLMRCILQPIQMKALEKHTRLCLGRCNAGFLNCHYWWPRSTVKTENLSNNPEYEITDFWKLRIWRNLSFLFQLSMNYWGFLEAQW